MCEKGYKKCAVNPGNRRWNQPQRCVISCLGINSLVSLHFRVRVQRRAVVWGGVELHEERHLIRGISCDGNSWCCAWFCLWIKEKKKKTSFKALFLFCTHFTQSGQIQLYFMLRKKLLPHLLGYSSVQEPAASRSPVAWLQCSWWMCWLWNDLKLPFVHSPRCHCSAWSEAGVWLSWRGAGCHCLTAETDKFE